MINNSGGGIFKIIPGPATTNALDYFEAPHGLTAEHICAMFGFEYQTAADIDAVQTELKAFYRDSDRPKVLEIFTPSQENDRVLKEYINHLR